MKYVLICLGGHWYNAKKDKLQKGDIMNEQNEQKSKKPAKTKKQKRGKYKSRSPRYPCISLREAIKNAKALYNENGRAFVAKEVAVKAWGYNRLHGRSLTVLAAMIQYGLIQYQGGNAGITDDAFTIIEAPRNSSERKTALEKCAKLPTIFDELHQSYAENLPSDEALEWTLKQRGFTEDGAQTTIECFRDTNTFVKEEIKDYNGDNGVKKEKPEDLSSKPQKPLYKPSEGDFVLSFTLFSGKNATLTISNGEPTLEEISFAKELLNSHLNTYEKKLSKK